MAQWIELIFWHGGFLPPILQCIVRKFGHSKYKGTFRWDYVQNAGLEKFHYGGPVSLNAVNKSIGTSTTDCLSRVGQVRLTALKTGRASYK